MPESPSLLEGSLFFVVREGLETNEGCYVRVDDLARYTEAVLHMSNSFPGVYYSISWMQVKC